MLKVSNDGLTKSWKPEKVWEPFYNGGKILMTSDGTRYVVEFEGNIKVVSVDDPSDHFSLFSEETEYEPISCFALNPANASEEITVATAKGTLLVYDLSTRQCQRTIRAHRMPILCMDYDATGTLVVTGSADRSVRVWDVTKGYCTHSFTNTHTDIVKTVWFHPDPQRLEVFSTSDDHSIAMFDLRDSQCVARFTEHFGLPTQVALTPDGHTLVSCGRDKVLNFYELREKKHLKTIPVMDELEAVVVLDATASEEILRSLDLKSVAKRSKHQVSHVLVTAGSQGILRVYSFEMKGKDAATFSVTSLVSIPLSQLQHSQLSEEMAALKSVSKLMLSTDKRSVTAITNDFNFARFSVQQFASALQTVTQRASSILSKDQADSDVVFMLPEHLLVSHQGDILDVLRLPPSEGKVKSSSTLLPFRLALVSNSMQLRIVDEHMSTSVLEGHTDIILAADVSPCGKWMATSSKDRTVRIWNVARGVCVAVCEGHTDPVGAVTLAHFPASYASRKVFAISGSGDKILKRFALPVHQWEQQQSLPSTGFLYSSSPQQSHVTLTSSHSIRAHDKDINCVAVSPNDALIASASQDKTIRLWNAEDLTAVATLRGHKRGVWKVLFSPVDKLLVSCSGDRTVKIWSAVDYTLMKTLEGHTASVLNARLVNHASQLLSTSADGLVRLWTLRSGECETTMDQHSDRVWAIETLSASSSVPTSTEEDEVGADSTSNGVRQEEYFMTGGSDAKLILWKDVTAEEEQARLEKAEELLVLEQQLHNDLRNRHYGKALKLAIALNHPSKALMILTAILEEDKSQPATETTEESKECAIFTDDFAMRLDPYLRELQESTDNGEEAFKTLLQFLKEWNTNSRHCYVSQILLHALFRVIKVEGLLQQRDFREMVSAMQAYTERHYQRVNRLSQAAHLIDYVVSRISILPMDALTALAVPVSSDDAKKSVVDETKMSSSAAEEAAAVASHSSKKRKAEKLSK